MQTRRYLRKWSSYRQKYGAMHAAIAFLGRNFPRFWKLVGPSVTRPYLRRWMKAHPDRRILNLGGGGNVSTEWLTADIDPRADVYCDLTKTLPFEDSCVDGILLEEVIEHIDYAAGRALLIECKRVLRPDGVIRVSTPSFAWIVGRWQRREPVPDGLVAQEAERILEVSPYDLPALSLAAVNATFYSHGHRFIYDEAVLGGQLSAAGFRGIDFGTYKDRHSSLGALDSHPDRFNHSPELSIYVEARKAASNRDYLTSTNVNVDRISNSAKMPGNGTKAMRR